MDISELLEVFVVADTALHINHINLQARVTIRLRVVLTAVRMCVNVCGISARIAMDADWVCAERR